MKLPVFFYGRLWNQRRVFWVRLCIAITLCAGAFVAAVGIWPHLPLGKGGSK